MIKICKNKPFGAVSGGDDPFLIEQSGAAHDQAIGDHNLPRPGVCIGFLASDYAADRF